MSEPRAGRIVAASRSSGVDVLTGDGLADALAGADALVDVTNPTSFDDDAVLAFFTTSATNIVEAARQATASRLRHSIVPITQFAEFADGITRSQTVGDEVRVPDALIQPMPADEVAATVARTASGAPLNGVVNIGGPMQITFEQLARGVLARNGDGAQSLVVEPQARYFGARLDTSSLVTVD